MQNEVRTKQTALWRAQLQAYGLEVGDDGCYKMGGMTRYKFKRSVFYLVKANLARGSIARQAVNAGELQPLALPLNAKYI